MADVIIGYTPWRRSAKDPNVPQSELRDYFLNTPTGRWRDNPAQVADYNNLWPGGMHEDGTIEQSNFPEDVYGTIPIDKNGSNIPAALALKARGKIFGYDPIYASEPDHSNDVQVTGLGGVISWVPKDSVTVGSLKVDAFERFMRKIISEELASHDLLIAGAKLSAK
jgi:hypothetical protein